MNIENLKKLLESDIEEIKSYNGCLTGDCPHNNSTDCNFIDHRNELDKCPYCGSDDWKTYKKSPICLK